MSKSYFGIIKDVFSSRNILTIAITTSMMTLCDMGWRPFWSLYLTNELGASVAVVGLLSMIQQSERLLFQLPGGILADRFGRRKIIVYGTALRIFTPILYLWAKTWVQIIPALLLNGVTSIYMPAFNAIIADSLPENQRGAGYGAYRMITSIPQIFSPVIGGILMDRLGYYEGVRLFMFISIFVNLIATIIRYKVITETLFDGDEMKKKTRKLPPIKDQIKDTFQVGRTVWIMVLVAVMGSFGGRMVMDFISIYAVDYIGLTNTQLGIVRTVGGIITVALALPGGMVADKFGKKPLISVSRLLTPISFFGTTLASNYPQFLFTQAISGLGEALGGGGARGRAGGPAWQALVADLVPREKRATVMGTIGTLTGIISAPASLLGSYLWTNINPAFPFRVASVIGLISVVIFQLGVKEEKKESKLIV